jgi:DNA-binding LacI/PurR family transcriptional regulator
MSTDGMRARRATLRDVAARAGVSAQTVSNLLNGRHTPRAETRQRVERAIRELGYRPNAAARALRSQRVASLAVLLEDPSRQGLHDPLHAEFLNGAAAAAHRLGYGLTLAITEPGETEREALRLVHEARAGGAVLSLGGFEPYRQRAVRALVAEGVPLVLLQQQVSLPGVFTVTAEDEVGAQRAVEHLIAHGHRRIAFLCGEPLWPGPTRRRAGFLAAATTSGVEAIDWRCSAYTIEAARELTARELAHTARPTAIVAANDLIALGVIQQAIEMGIDVPRDLSVIGFNDFDFAAWVRPAITTVRIPGAEMGARAIELLIGALDGSVRAQGSVFQAELVLRASTAPAPS